jgi:hypothetical protein
MKAMRKSRSFPHAATSNPSMQSMPIRCERTITIRTLRPTAAISPGCRGEVAVRSWQRALRNPATGRKTASGSCQAEDRLSASS